MSVIVTGWKMQGTLNDEFFIGQLDYDICNGLYCWENGKYKAIDDFCRLKIFTERIQEFLEEKTGKKVPLLSEIELTKEELNEVRKCINEEKRFIGVYGTRRGEDELHYDYKWNEL